MVAHYIASRKEDKNSFGLLPEGFATPERFVPGKWILDEISKREGAPG
jgi:hypothetical protein